MHLDGLAFWLITWPISDLLSVNFWPAGPAVQCKRLMDLVVANVFRTCRGDVCHLHDAFVRRRLP